MDIYWKYSPTETSFEMGQIERKKEQSKRQLWTLRMVYDEYMITATYIRDGVLFLSFYSIS